MRLAHRLLKRQKIDVYHLTAGITIAFAAALRLALVLLHWPSTNSDEGTMVIMATNIAYHGEWPLNFYHQAYMGPIEAYLGALLFHLTGGPSITALRIGVILLVTLFFICLYQLTSHVFSRKLALVTLLFLSVGSIPFLTRQTIATGGSAETLLFGTLAFLLAFWLGATRYGPVTRMHQRKRLLVYAAFGLVVGVGVWSDMVILPCVVLATLLLLRFCAGDLLHRGRWLIVLLCGLLGFLPCLIYNAQQGTNPALTLLDLVHGTGSQAPTTLAGLWHNVVATVQISLPTATSLPFCPVLEYPFLGDNTPPSLHCAIVHTTWGVGYLLLAGTTLLCTGIPLWQMQRHKSQKKVQHVKVIIERSATLQSLKEEYVEAHYLEQVRLTTRLCLSLIVLSTLLIFIPSSGPVDQPGYHARYLIGLLIATPAILAPLWNSATTLRETARWRTLRQFGSRALMLGLILVLVIGTTRAIGEIRKAHAQERLYMDVAHHLEALKVTRFYADYWVCYNLMIDTNYKLICSVIDSSLSPNHERDEQTRAIVNTTGRASWMCAQDLSLTRPEYNCLPALEAMMHKIPSYQFHRYTFDGYVLYKNTGPEVPSKLTLPPTP